MSTTLTNRDKMLLLVLAGVLVFFAVYMTVVKDYTARCEAEQAKRRAAQCQGIPVKTVDHVGKADGRHQKHDRGIERPPRPVDCQPSPHA